MPTAKTGYETYRVGDVVTTRRRVPCYLKSGRADGTAEPGWLWRVVGVVPGAPGKPHQTRYRVVAHTAPGLYRQVLSPAQIAGRVK